MKTTPHPQPRSRKRRGETRAALSRKGETVRYGTGKTRIGPVLAAVSLRGLCELRLLGANGHDPVALLQERHPLAELIQDERGTAQVIRQVDELLAGKRSSLGLDLDLNGTPFQQRVWQTMLQIPRGQTWTYSELARRVGRPRAVRAVGNACGKNPVAVVVPCHRVLRKDGSLGGYGSGASYKEKLLRLEGVALRAGCG